MQLVFYAQSQTHGGQSSGGAGLATTDKVPSFLSRRIADGAVRLSIATMLLIFFHSG